MELAVGKSTFETLTMSSLGLSFLLAVLPHSLPTAMSHRSHSLVKWTSMLRKDYRFLRMLTFSSALKGQGDLRKPAMGLSLANVP